MIGIITTLLGIGGNWLQGRAERAKLKEERKTEIERAKNEIIKNRENAEIDWDLLMAKGSQDSWKDEFWTIILAIPVIGCFIPPLTPFIEKGFIVLSTQVPEWYLYSLGVAIAAAFGVRQLSNKIGGK